MIRSQSSYGVLVACFFGIVTLCTTTVGAAPGGPVKVFILAGQSNMEGKAAVTTLDAVLGDARMREEFQHLKKGDEWAVRDDVWVTFLDRQNRGTPVPVHGPLTVGFGSPKQVRDETGKRVPVAAIGPELGIGHILGDHHDEQVLLIKAAWGGRAVKYSFRPPSAMPTDEQIREEVAAIRAKNAKNKKKNIEVTFESRKEGYGSDYRKILSETRRVLDDLETLFPGYDKSQGYELTGFIWFQGWNDGVGGGNPEYVEQMAHFIRDIRRDLKAPKLPFVIGELGTDGHEAGGWVAKFREQQAAIAALPEFEDDVRLAKTAHCWPTDQPDLSEEWQEFRTAAKKNEQKPESDPTRASPGEYYQRNWVQKYRKQLAYTSDKRYHYLGSGACYYRMGVSMAKAILELVGGKSP